jgi:cobalt/nickel transport system ATP-binding protein
MEPELLVLDEPSANLDPRARRELLDVLAALDRTLLVVTHDLPFAAELCERAVILSRGRVAADGPCAALLSDPALLAGHDLELPAGFDPARVTRRPRPAGVSRLSPGERREAECRCTGCGADHAAAPISR